MCKLQKYDYAVFGNPINHSKSPKIHSYFSQITGIFYSYKAINVPLGVFPSVVLDFFKGYGKGSNVTAPFKEQAYLLSDKLTERAKIAESVNTLKKVDDGSILGDNTDGTGLLSDLIRLNFIKKNYLVLILGAGGAVRGILHPLLSFGCSVFILNRSNVNAEKVVLKFKKYGNLNVFNNQLMNKKYFNLIINARSRDAKDMKNFVPLSMISSKTFFYDMNYNSINTPFVNWCSSIGARFFSDGIGMLVFQAAHSFFLWHDIFPSTELIIKILSQENKMCLK
ncbi:shikimate dehydrogenase [Buchnera aphidicola (Muscaphis stroyani)]|uniref:Shikimate dehydrogenase (NADP(+)) n=1 Tax=Buchnera aphidicola (Muscaphis stroyani) TaxID=1241869 RepID=A0A4D6YJ53_9GAMM|nr:shikimate dehydrogenase [Buchnera aphidicola]QCI24525.1 shikimate dehydrogenase [Buchnera aphidicola (Muscaphis stroyani)]